ncbi:hypothetical protein CQA53_11195 [Helicobacter didelphidarum]|uniref:Uncharacterized protein n=1 Tax=Helicobacter didelphidarum TaxID=2040648 RepID=A0A3D8I424_9HELI|nr:hypothetical protein [Helicobacter didelphidarum]RDU59877.1 hypothetical protein CQA53_11195 [Helicobacter didelphidarum]
MVLLYMWLKQGISDFDNLVLAIAWIFYFIIMPFIISMLNKTEFFNAIFYSKPFFMLWIITILLGTTCAILYFGWDWLLLLNIAATGITTITLTLLPILNTDSKHKMSILESLFVFLIFCVIFVDNVIASPFFILFYGTSLIGLGGR